MARATTSLPTPLSTCSNTVMSRAATIAIRSRIACMFALLQSRSSSVMDHPLGPMECKRVHPGVRRVASTLAMTDHHERLGGQLGGPFQDPLNEARITRGGVGEGSEREREAQDDEPPSRGNQCRTTSEHDSPTKKTPSREFHRPLPGRSVLELGAPISLGWRT